MSCRSLRSVFLAVNEFKRIYLTQCIQLGLPPKREILTIIQNVSCGNGDFEKIDLSHSDIDDDSVIPLISALKTNWTIKSLNLSHNRIKNLTVFKDLLTINKYIEGLDISNNGFTRTSAIQLADYLHTNPSIQWFNLDNKYEHSKADPNPETVLRGAKNRSQDYSRSIPKRPDGPTDTVFIRTTSPHSARSMHTRSGSTSGKPIPLITHRKENKRLLMSRMEWILQLRKILDDLVLELEAHIFHKKHIIRAVLLHRNEFSLLSEEVYRSQYLDKGFTLKQILQTIEDSEKLFLTYDDIIERVSTIDKRETVLEDDLFLVSSFTRAYTEPEEDYRAYSSRIQPGLQQSAVNTSFNNCSISTDKQAQERRALVESKEAKRPLSLDFKKLTTFSTEKVDEQPQIWIETSFRQEVHDMDLVASAGRSLESSEFLAVGLAQFMSPLTGRQEKGVENLGDTHRSNLDEKKPSFGEVEQREGLTALVDVVESQRQKEESWMEGSPPVKEVKQNKEAWTQCGYEVGDVEDLKANEIFTGKNTILIEEEEMLDECRAAEPIKKEEPCRVTIETQTEPVIVEKINSPRVESNIDSQMIQESSKEESEQQTIEMVKEATEKSIDKSAISKEEVILKQKPSIYELPLLRGPDLVERSNDSYRSTAQFSRIRRASKHNTEARRAKSCWKTVDISGFVQKSRANRSDTIDNMIDSLAMTIQTEPADLKNHEPITLKPDGLIERDLELNPQGQSILEEIRDLLRSNFALQARTNSNSQIFHDFQSFTKQSIQQDSHASPKAHIIDLNSQQSPEASDLKKDDVLESPQFRDHQQPSIRDPTAGDNSAMDHSKSITDKKGPEMEAFISQQIEEGSIKIKDLLKGYYSSEDSATLDRQLMQNTARPPHKESSANEYSVTADSHYMIGDTQVTVPSIHANDQSRELSRHHYNVGELDSSNEDERSRASDLPSKEQEEVEEEEIIPQKSSRERGVASLRQFKEALECIKELMRADLATDDEIQVFSQLARFQVHELGIDSIVSFLYDASEDLQPPPFTSRVFQTVLAFTWGIKVTGIPDPVSAVQFPWHQDIRILNLSGNGLTTIEFISNLKNLEYLNLNYNRIQNIPNSACMSSLKELHLSHNRLSQISFLLHCAKLTLLDLSFNEISSYEALACLSHNTRLQAVGIRGNPLTKRVKYISTLNKMLPQIPGLDAFDESLSSFRKYGQLTMTEIGTMKKNYRTSSISSMTASRASISSSKYSDSRPMKPKLEQRPRDRSKEVVEMKRPVQKSMKIPNWENLHKRNQCTAKPATLKGFESARTHRNDNNTTKQPARIGNVLQLTLKRGTSSIRDRSAFTERQVPQKQANAVATEKDCGVGGILTNKIAYSHIHSSKRRSFYSRSLIMIGGQDHGTSNKAISMATSSMSSRMPGQNMVTRPPTMILQAKILPAEKKIFRR